MVGLHFSLRTYVLFFTVFYHRGVIKGLCLSSRSTLQNIPVYVHMYGMCRSALHMHNAHAPIVYCFLPFYHAYRRIVGTWLIEVLEPKELKYK